MRETRIVSRGARARSHPFARRAAAMLPLFALAGCWFGGALTGLGIYEAADEDEGPAPTLSYVDPSRVDNNADPLRLTIYGEHLAGPCSVALEDPDGGFEIEGQISELNPYMIKATFEPPASFTEFSGTLNVCARVDGTRCQTPDPLHVSKPTPLQRAGARGVPRAFYEAPFDPQHIAALDIDGDKQADLAVASRSEHEIQLYLGDGDGSFRPQEPVKTDYGALWLAVVPSEALPSELGRAVGEVLVVATEKDVEVVFLGPGIEIKPITGAELEPPEGRCRIVAGDFDGDGLVDDLVLGTEDEPEMRVLWSMGLEGQELFGAQFGSPSDMAVADFSCDGRDDLVIVSLRRQSLDFYLSAGPDSGHRGFLYAGTDTVAGGPQAVAAGNLYDPLRADRYPDIVLVKGTDEVAYMNVVGIDTDAFGQPVVNLAKGSRSASVGRNPKDLLFVDLGGPGRVYDGAPRAVPDVIATNRDSGDVSIAITPRVDLGDAQTIPVWGRPKAAAVVNLYADEPGGETIYDLIAVVSADPFTDYGRGYVTILVRRPDMPVDAVRDHFAIPFCSEPIYRPSLVGIAQADLDGDGMIDFVAASRETNELAVVLANSGAYNAIDFFPTGSMGTRMVRIADMDRDGAPDLVASHRIRSEISILYNSGTRPPRFYARDIIDLSDLVEPPNPVRIQTLAVGDFDGDARPDLAVAMTLADKVAILWNEGPGGGDGGGGGDGEGAPRVRFKKDPYHCIGPDPRWVEAADFDDDGDVDVLVACETREFSKTNIQNGGITILVNQLNEANEENEGSRRFKRYRLPPWGATSCSDAGYYPVTKKLWKDEAEYVVCAHLGAPGESTGPMHIVMTNGDGFSYYSPNPKWAGGSLPVLPPVEPGTPCPFVLPTLSEPYVALPRWIPVNPIHSTQVCPSGFCIDERGDPEFVLLFDIDGDGRFDIASIDEELDRIFFLRNTGAPDPEAAPCLSERFVLEAELESESPQGLSAFTHEGRTYVVSVERGSATMGMYVYDGGLKPWKDVLLHRQSRGRCDAIASGAGIVCQVRQERSLLQFDRVAHLAAASGGEWLAPWTPDLGAVSLQAGAGATPQTAAIRELAPQSSGSFDLAIGAVRLGAAGEEAGPVLYIVPNLADAALPSAGTSVALEMLGDQQGGLRAIALPEGKGWIALRVADLGSPLGQLDGVPDLVAATDRGVWILFGQEGGGLGDPILLFSGEGSDIRDVVLGLLDGDAAGDCTVATSSGKIAVAFGPFGETLPPWAEVRPPRALADVTCCGIGSVANRGESAGILVVAEEAGKALIFVCDEDRRIQCAAEHDVGQGPADIGFGDLNCDRLPDIAIGSEKTGDVTVLVGEGEGTFSRSNAAIFAGGAVQSLLVLDINGDGSDDVLVANDGTGLFMIMN